MLTAESEMPRTYLVFGDIEDQARRAPRRMHKVLPQGPLQRPQAHQEAWPQGQHDEIKGAA
jgi:hypothetical protein